MSKIYERLRNEDAKLVEKYTLFLRLLDLVMTTYTKNQRLITGNRVYDRALEVLDHISYLIVIEDKKKKAERKATEGLMNDDYFDDYDEVAFESLFADDSYDLFDDAFDFGV